MGKCFMNCITKYRYQHFLQFCTVFRMFPEVMLLYFVCLYVVSKQRKAGLQWSNFRFNPFIHNSIHGCYFMIRFWMNTTAIQKSPVWTLYSIYVWLSKVFSLFINILSCSSKCQRGVTTYTKKIRHNFVEL